MIASNATPDELLRLLENHDDADVREIASRFDKLDLSEREELDAEPDILTFVDESVTLTAKILADPDGVWQSDSRSQWTLLGYNEDTHVASQDVKLRRTGKQYTVTVTCGFHYDPENCEHFHGERSVEHSFTAENLHKAKRMANDWLVNNVIAKNLIAGW